MLSELRLTAFGVVDEALLELGPGLTALTGETGAGKTMLVAGLGHLLGFRGDSSIVRRGAGRAVVQGRWEIPAGLVARIEELGGVVEGDELIAIRQITAQGRTRAVLGGAGVPVAALAEIIGELATIHGQSEQLRLATPERQRELLDQHAAPAELERYRKNFAARKAAAAECETLMAQASARDREADMLRFGLSEIEAVNPQPGEDENLAAEQRRLMDLDELRALASAAHVALSGDETDFDTTNALTLLGQARKQLDQLAERDTAAQQLLERCLEATMLATELAGDVAGYLDDLVADPLRLEAVSQRRAELAGLTRKYGNNVDEVLAWAAAGEARLIELEGSDERISQLRAELARLDEQLAHDAASITSARKRAAAELASAVKEELVALAMPHAELVFEMSPAPLGPHGADRVELLFAANPGAAPAPLAKVASGGELSRVRLALEVVLAADSAGHTFVFDEVDAGVGGAVGLEIGRRLQRLASHSQVIVVTHLAQVAAFADAHFVVAKADDGKVTTSDVRRLGEDERVAELARMMSGEATSTKGLAHAKELLANGRRR